MALPGEPDEAVVAKPAFRAGEVSDVAARKGTLFEVEVIGDALSGVVAALSGAARALRLWNTSFGVGDVGDFEAGSLMGEAADTETVAREPKSSAGGGPIGDGAISYFESSPFEPEPFGLSSSCRAPKTSAGDIEVTERRWVVCRRHICSDGTAFLAAARSVEAVAARP